jgi:hypothetical protein
LINCGVRESVDVLMLGGVGQIYHHTVAVSAQ